MASLTHVTCIGGVHDIDNNLVLILSIQVSYYTPRAVLVIALIPGAFLVFVYNTLKLNLCFVEVLRTTLKRPPSEGK
jgi:hypothetical protein